MENKYILLDLTNRRQVTLCNHNFSKEGILHPDRIMDEYDLLFMQNGEWDIIEDETEYHLSPGSVLLLEPGKHHYSTRKCSPLMRNVYIHFTAEKKDIDSVKAEELLRNRLSPEALSHGVSYPEVPSLTSFLPIPKLVQTADHKEIHHTFERVIDAFWAVERNQKELRCSLYLESLLLQLSELSRKPLTKTDILISEIIHRFHCEPEVFLSPQELAENYNVSVRTISGRFKERTGISLHQYQLQLKLDMAYDLLPISPGRSLHDIALSLGFYDEFQFSRLFKRKFGISPSMRR